MTDLPDAVINAMHRQTARQLRKDQEYWDEVRERGPNPDLREPERAEGERQNGN